MAGFLYSATELFFIAVVAVVDALVLVVVGRSLPTVLRFEPAAMFVVPCEEDSSVLRMLLPVVTSLFLELLV